MVKLLSARAAPMRTKRFRPLCVRLNSSTRIVTTAGDPDHLPTSVRKHFSPEPISLFTDRGATLSVTPSALIVVSATWAGYYMKLELWCIGVEVVRATSIV
jgi:hypothetical protein